MNRNGMLRIGGEFSERVTYLIDAETQQGYASVQQRSNAVFEIPPDATTIRMAGETVTIHRDMNNYVVSVHCKRFTLASVIVAVQALNVYNKVDLGFLMTSIQISDFARTHKA